MIEHPPIHSCPVCERMQWERLVHTSISDQLQALRGFRRALHAMAAGHFTTTDQLQVASHACQVVIMELDLLAAAQRTQTQSNCPQHTKGVLS